MTTLADFYRKALKNTGAAPMGLAGMGAQDAPARLNASAAPGGAGVPPPDTDPTGRIDAPGAGTGAPAGGDFWSQFLSKIGRYGADTSQVAAGKDKLAPMVAAALGYAPWGGADKILNYLDYNPNKGLYTALSYLTGNPYYDRTDDGGYKLFKVPGFDYGAADDSWLGTVDDPKKLGYYST